MKINILYNFKKGPWGGGNQFLKALRKEWKTGGVYTESPKEADVIIFNSFPFRAEHFFDELFRLKKKYPGKLIVYRLNGPISFIRGTDKEVDRIISLFNKLLVDGIIFQSEWCKRQNKKFFGTSSEYETVIHNAPDTEIFNTEGKQEFNPQQKTKLIAVSWSSNLRKGFDVYEYLDENLDFSKYEMTFVGKAPLEFKNIQHIESLSSEKLATELKKYDIYITASRNDPCSNSLIEALSCGLPAVARDDGGHPDLLGRGGELFNKKEDIIEKIKTVEENYNSYRNNLPEFSIEKAARKYYNFAHNILSDAENGEYRPKRVNFSVVVGFYIIKIRVLFWKAQNKLKAIWKKILKI